THRGAGRASRARRVDALRRLFGWPGRAHGRRARSGGPEGGEPMTLRPEQIKARESFQEKGTLLPAEQIHERVAAAFAATEAFFQSVGDDEARARAIPREWTIHEVVDHLIETHRPSFDELRDLLDGRRPAGGPIPASLQSADPMARPFGDLLGDLKAAPAAVLGVLSAAPQRMAGARAPILMVGNVKEPDGREAPLHWIEELDWKAYAVTAFRLHEVDHLNQARKTLKAARVPR